MDIIWHGKTAFTFKDKGTTIVVNPHKELGKIKANAVLSSLNPKDLADIDENTRVFDWPGEYEVSDVPIIGFQAWTKSKSKEETEGVAGDPTIIFYFEIDGIKICHLGDLGHVITSEMVKEIGDIDILLINGGKSGNLGTKKALEVLEAIDPRCVIPMGNEDFSEFLKELGAGNVTPVDKFSLKSSADLPEDKRQYIVLSKA